MALVEFDREYVEVQLTRCTQFLNELRSLIYSLSEGGAFRKPQLQTNYRREKPS